MFLHESNHIQTSYISKIKIDLLINLALFFFFFVFTQAGLGSSQGSSALVTEETVGLVTPSPDIFRQHMAG